MNISLTLHYFANLLYGHLIAEQILHILLIDFFIKHNLNFFNGQFLFNLAGNICDSATDITYISLLAEAWGHFALACLRANQSFYFTQSKALGSLYVADGLQSEFNYILYIFPLGTASQ